MPTLAASPAEAVRGIPAGARIVMGPGCGTPVSLLEAVAAAADEGRGWELITGLVLGELTFPDAVRQGRLRHSTWHVSAANRHLLRDGLAEYLPLRGAFVPRYLRATGVDALLVRVSPPDASGWCSLGTSVSFPLPASRHAGVVIGEVDAGMPRTMGRSAIHVSRFAALVDTAHEMPTYQSREPGEVSRRLAERVIALIPPGATLQLGIGEVPEALATMLQGAGLGPLRFIGMGMDAMADLADSGVVDASQVVPSPAVAAVELMGTRRLFDWADRNPAVGVYPVDEWGSSARLAALERLVSVNSAVAVDLTGQVNAEFAGGRQLSGVGGSSDFNEAAALSPGGRRILALPSTSGEHSRIVAALDPRAPVTLSRHSVEHVVTEYGAVDLSRLPLRRRADALIELAHPDHRDRLAREAEALFAAPAARRGTTVRSTAGATPAVDPPRG